LSCRPGSGRLEVGRVEPVFVGERPALRRHAGEPHQAGQGAVSASPREDGPGPAVVTLDDDARACGPSRGTAPRTTPRWMVCPCPCPCPCPCLWLGGRRRCGVELVSDQSRSIAVHGSALAFPHPGRHALAPTPGHTEPPPLLSRGGGSVVRAGRQLPHKCAPSRAPGPDPPRSRGCPRKILPPESRVNGCGRTHTRRGSTRVRGRRGCATTSAYAHPTTTAARPGGRRTVGRGVRVEQWTLATLAARPS